MRWTCGLGCGELEFADLEDAARHLEEHGHHVDRWADGAVVVVDKTLEPAEFAEPDGQ